MDYYLISILINKIYLFLGNAENVVEIVPRGQVAVRVGESLRIMCRVGQPVQFCRVEIPSQRSMVLQPNQNANDGIEYYGEGLQTGQCGVYIHHVKEEYNGTFKCGIITNGNRQEINNSLDIIVASKYFYFYSHLLLRQ